MNTSLRVFHRWTSIVFTVAVLINLVALAAKAQSTWVGMLALFPFIALMLTGLYLFFAPYFKRRATTVA